MKEQNNDKGLSLFVSFDITNSTQFKAQNTNWLKIYLECFNSIIDNYHKLNKDKWKLIVTDWLSLGDEIIVKIDFDIENIKELTTVIKDIYSIMVENSNSLKSSNELGLKGTAWIVKIIEIYEYNDITDNENDVQYFTFNTTKLPIILPKCIYDNLCKDNEELLERCYKLYINPIIVSGMLRTTGGNKYTTDDNYLYILNTNITIDDKIKMFDIIRGNDLHSLNTHEDNLKELNHLSVMNRVHNDILGKRTDEGFRLTKFTDKNILCLSAELTYLIKKLDSDKEININHIGYATLKGIWNNNPYPIYWYKDGNVDKKTLEKIRINKNIFSIPYYDISIEEILENNNLGMDNEASIIFYYKDTMEKPY